MGFLSKKSTDAAAPVEVGRTYATSQLLQVIIPPAGGPFVDSQGDTAPLGSRPIVNVPDGWSQTGATLTEAEFLLVDVAEARQLNINTDFVQHSQHYQYLPFTSTDLTVTDGTMVIGLDRRLLSSRVVVAQGAANPGMTVPAGTNTIEFFWASNMTGTAVNFGIVGGTNIAHRIFNLTTGTLTASAVGADSGTAAIAVLEHAVTTEGTYAKLAFSCDVAFEIRMGAYIGDLTPAWSADMLWLVETAPLTLPAFRLRQTKLTPQSGVEDTTEVNYANTDGTAVLVIDNVPANETIASINFLQLGTVNAAAGSFQRLAPNTVSLSGIVEDVDIEVITGTVVAPELRLTRSSFKMVPGAADVSPSDDAWVSPGNYTKRLNLRPNSKVVITAYPMGYVVGSTIAGTSIAARDGAASLLAGGDRTTVADIDALEPIADLETWAWVMRPQVVGNARASYQPITLPEFTVPGDGVVDFVIAIYGNFRADLSGSGWIMTVEEVESVTIAALDRIQSSYSLTLAGPTFFATSPNRVSDSENTIYDQIANPLRVAVPAGQEIDTIAAVDCAAVLGDRHLTENYQIVNVHVEGANPSITVSLKALALAGTWNLLDPVIIAASGGGFDNGTGFSNRCQWLIQGKVLHLNGHIDWTASTGGNIGSGQYYIDISQFGGAVILNQLNPVSATSQIWGVNIYGISHYHDPGVAYYEGSVIQSRIDNAITFEISTNEWGSDHGHLGVRPEIQFSATIPIQ